MSLALLVLAAGLAVACAAPLPLLPETGCGWGPPDISPGCPAAGWSRPVANFSSAVAAAGPPAAADTSVVVLAVPKCASTFLSTVVRQTFGSSRCQEKGRHMRFVCHGGFSPREPRNLRVLGKLGDTCSATSMHWDSSVLVTQPLPHVKRLFVLTSLREPVVRLLSACEYAHSQQCHSANFFLRFVRTNVGYAGANHMTHQVAGLDPACSVLTGSQAELDKVCTESDVLAIAKARLESMTYVCVTSRMPDCLRMLEAVMHIPVHNPGKVNPQTVAKSKLALTKDDLSELEPFVNLDRQLYSFATDLFEARLREIDP